MSDEKAQRLAELGIKRNRTMADLDAIQEAARSTRRSIQAFIPKYESMIQEYLDRLEEGNIPSDQCRGIYKELYGALTENIADFKELVNEWERQQVQERILLQMLVELDHRIEKLRAELA